MGSDTDKDTYRPSTRLTFPSPYTVMAETKLQIEVYYAYSPNVITDTNKCYDPDDALISSLMSYRVNAFNLTVEITE